MQDWVELMDLIGEDDIAWLLNTGYDRRVEAGAALLCESSMSDALYFVIDGLFEVTKAAGGRPLPVVGPGEIVGEISFLDKQPASATVRAQEDSRVLEIPRHQLSSKLQGDRQFAARFYRALAVILAGRLRRMTASHDPASPAKKRTSPADSTASAAIEQALESFKAAVSEAAGFAVKGEARIPDAQTREVRSRFRALITTINEFLGDGCKEPESVRKELGRVVQQELLPYILLARTAHRLYAKPRGYAGDYQTLDMIYQNQPGGSGPTGALIDRLFLEETAAESLRNRRTLILDEIRGTIKGARERGAPARVTSLACGPAGEVFDAYGTLDDRSWLETTLVDFDLQALAHVSAELERRQLAKQARLINGNVVYLALGREQLDLEPQDLVYAAGLIDGFSDSVCKRVIDYAHGVLRPGGKLLLCGFHPKNDNRLFLQHVLDWSPHHRSEDELNRLFSESAFGRPCTRLRFDDRGASLLAECVK